MCATNRSLDTWQWYDVACYAESAVKCQPPELFVCMYDYADPVAQKYEESGLSIEMWRLPIYYSVQQ